MDCHHIQLVFPNDDEELCLNVFQIMKNLHRIYSEQIKQLLDENDF